MTNAMRIVLALFKDDMLVTFRGCSLIVTSHSHSLDSTYFSYPSIGANTLNTNNHDNHSDYCTYIKQTPSE